MKNPIETRGSCRNCQNRLNQISIESGVCYHCGLPVGNTGLQVNIKEIPKTKNEGDVCECGCTTFAWREGCCFCVVCGNSTKCSTT